MNILQDIAIFPRTVLQAGVERSRLTRCLIETKVDIRPGWERFKEFQEFQIPGYLQEFSH